MTQSGEGVTPKEVLTANRAFNLAEEQAAGILPAEFSYYDIPVMTAGEVLPQCGFDQLSARNSKAYFLDALKQVFANPGWLLTDPKSEEWQQRVEAGLPVPQEFREGEATALKSIFANSDPTRLAEETNRTRFIHGIDSTDIFIRAIEVMSDIYPNLMFSRGGSFHQNNLGFDVGPDFAPGDLPRAMFAYDSGAYTGQRASPVLAMIRFKDLVREWGKGNISSLYSEAEWWRGSTAITPKGQKARTKLYRLRKLPQSVDRRKEILLAYKQQAIPTKSPFEI